MEGLGRWSREHHDIEGGREANTEGRRRGENDKTREKRELCPVCLPSPLRGFRPQAAWPYLKETPKR